MSSLYYAPLNNRLKVYYKKEVSEKQKNINHEYILNQQLLFDEKMQRNMYIIFENQKKIIEKLKTESQNLNTYEFQKKLYLENPEMYLPPSEKSNQSLIEQPEIFKLPPSEKSNQLLIEQPEIFALPPSTRKALEAEQENKPKGGTPKASTSLTPVNQLAKDAALRIKLKDYPLYEAFRNLPRAKKGGLPEIATMVAFANINNIDISNKTKSKEIADTIIKGISNIKGEGFKKFMPRTELSKIISCSKKNKYHYIK